MSYETFEWYFSIQNFMHMYPVFSYSYWILPRLKYWFKCYLEIYWSLEFIFLNYVTFNQHEICWQGKVEMIFTQSCMNRFVNTHVFETAFLSSFDLSSDLFLIEMKNVYLLTKEICSSHSHTFYGHTENI